MDNWIGHILRKNCLLERIIEGKIETGLEVTGRKRRRRKQLLDDLKETTGHYKLKEEALGRTVWTNRFRKVYGPVVRHCGMNASFHTGSGVHPGSCSMRAERCLARKKREQREADYSLLPSAKERINGTKPPLLCKPSWRAERQICLVYIRCYLERREMCVKVKK